MKVINSSRC